MIIWLYDPGRTGRAPFRLCAFPTTKHRLARVDLHAAYPYTNTAPVKPPLGQALLWGVGLLGIAGLLWQKQRRRAVLIALLLVVAAGAWWLTTSWSEGVWEIVAPLRTLQFPYRLHSLIALGVALGAAAALPRSARARPPSGSDPRAPFGRAGACRPPVAGGGDQPANRVVDGARLRLDETGRYGRRNNERAVNSCRAPSGGRSIRPAFVVVRRSMSGHILSASGSVGLSVPMPARWTCMASTAAPTGWPRMSLP